VLAFHLDEHMNNAIAQGLRSRGISVTTTSYAGLLGAEDSEHVAFALTERRVIVANDADFLAFAGQSTEHAGITYVPRGSRSIGHIVRHLCLMSDCLEPAEMKGRVEFL
jgi:predicted nuclease of predicted toxin-antitoxin system